MKIKIGELYLNTRGDLCFYTVHGIRLKRTMKGKLKVLSNMDDEKLGKVVEFKITNRHLYDKVYADDELEIGHFRLVPLVFFNKKWKLNPAYTLVYKADLYYAFSIKKFFFKTNWIAKILVKIYCINGIMGWTTRKFEKEIMFKDEEVNNEN